MAWIELDHEIPWALSDIKPRELRSSDDPAIREIQRKEALIFSKGPRCHRCGEYYSKPNPECSGSIVHDKEEAL